MMVLQRGFTWMLLIATIVGLVDGSDYILTGLGPQGGSDFVPVESPYQSEISTTYDFLLIPGSNLDDFGTTDLPDRYNCADNQILFERDPDDKLTLLATVTTTYGQEKGKDAEGDCSLDWGDDTAATELHFDNDTGPELSAVHTYTAAGLYYPVASCSGHGRQEVCPDLNPACIENGTVFDRFFKDVATPQKYLATEPFAILGHMTIVDACKDDTPNYNWRLFHIYDENLTLPFTDFPQPGVSALKLLPQTMEPGLYVAEIEVTFPGRSAADMVTDFIYVRILLPELIAAIAGGTELTIPRGDTYIADATKSRDPVTRLDSITSLPLQANWSVVCYTTISQTTLYRYVVRFPNQALPVSASGTTVQPGTDYRLQVDTGLLGTSTLCLLLFTLERGERASSALQVIHIKDNGIKLALSCVFNCNLGREMKMTQEQIQFDSVVDPTVTGATYRWYIQRYSTVYNIFSDISLYVQTQTGLITRSLGVSKGQLQSGTTYRFRLMVSATGKVTSYASYVRTVNYLPYAGSCVIDRVSGRAALELFTVNCSGWQGADERKTLDSLNLLNLKDSNPLLSFSVLQRTSNAYLEEELIACSKARKFHILLKLGDPDNTFMSTLAVRVIDLYNNYKEILIDIQALPAFPYDNVTGNQAGADIVESFIATDFVTSRQQLINLGKRDLLVIHATSIASHFQQINLTAWTPPFPRTVQSDTGAILDLNAGEDNSSSSSSSLNEMLQAAFNETIDPATVAIQGVVEDLTAFLVVVLRDDIVNGPRREDKKYISTLTNALTNMVARPNYVTLAVKSSLIQAGALLSGIALFPAVGQQEEDDAGPQIEVSSSELVDMYKSTVNAVVPDTLSQVDSTVSDFNAGRYQLRDQVEIEGLSDSLDEAAISPEERAFLLLRMQSQLAYDLETARLIAKDSASAALQMARDIQKAARLCLTCSNEERSNTKQVLVKHDAEVVAQRSISAQNASVRLTGLQNLGNDSVSASIVTFEENVFMYDKNKKSSHISSPVIHIDVKSTQTDAVVSTGFITYRQRVPTPDARFVTPVLDAEDASYFSLHKLIYRTSEDFVCVIVRPEGDGLRQYEIYVNFGEAPTVLTYEFITYVNVEDNWQACVPPSQMQSYTGIVYLGVQMKKDEPVADQAYYFTVITGACMVWQESTTEWLSDKCDLQWLPDEDTINCQCRDVQDLTLANSFYVAPNSIDFSSVFLKFSPLNQAAVMGTLAAVFLLYLLAVLLVRRLDRSDILKWGITPLRDNVYSHSYFYIMTVYTGLRRSAGTSSRVGFVLTGNHADTGDRELGDGVRQEFERGSVLSFLMATKKHLGDLFHLAVWHDNSGQDDLASWYPSKIVVQDLHTDNTYIFIFERWISIDTTLEAKVLPNLHGKAIPFSSRFFHHAKDRLSEGHMWISIGYRPTTSNFSRVQRVSCALVYVMLTMIANAVYFNPEDNYEAPAAIQVGPLRFSLQQMYVAMICALISTPAVLLIAFLFQRSRRPPASHYNSISYKDRGLVEEQTPSKLSWFQRQRVKSLELERCLLTRGVPEYRGCFLHYNFEYIGWALVFIGTVLPAFFILLYSMEWGKQKSEKWLSALFLSFLESFIFVDPIMVLLIALVFALILRSGQFDTTHVDKVHLMLTYRKHFRRRPPYTPNPPARPQQGDDLELAAKRYRHHKIMKSTLKNVLINLFFIWILASISYSNRDDRSYYLHREITNELVSPPKMPQFTKIKTPNDVYVWLNYTVFPGLFPVHDINGVELHWTVRQFMAGFVNYRLGPPRLRQLRTKKSTCSVPLVGAVDCYGGYEFLDEDTSNYCIGWSEASPCPVEERVLNYSSQAWRFTSALDVWGLPVAGLYTTYGGGGYIAEFAVNLDTSLVIFNELYNSIWLDRKTRAVLFEFTLYNGNANLFVYNMFLVEFPETGGAFTTHKIFPLRLYQHSGSVGTYTLICEIIFILCLIILLVKICITFYQQRCKYFSQVWQVYELVQFAVGVAAVAMYAIRYALTKFTIEKFKEDEKLFVNFYHVVFWDELFVTFLGILVFMATIRLLQLFGAVKKVGAVVTVFRHCGSDLFWFGLNMVYTFIGFAFLGHFLFGPYLFSYMSIYRSMTTLFTALIGASRFREINQTDPLMAKIFYLLFIIIVSFFIFTLFLSILSGSVDTVIHDSRQDTKEDLIDMVMDKFRRLMWTPSPRAAVEAEPREGPADSDPADATANSARKTSLIDSRRIRALEELIHNQTETESQYMAFLAASLRTLQASDKSDDAEEKDSLTLPN